MDKRAFLGVIVAILIVPQITLAAWWNPLSWFSNWTFSNPPKDTQVQVLENRIKELEKKLENKSDGISTATETTATTTTTTQVLLPAKKSSDNQVPMSPQPPKKPVVVPKPPVPLVVQPIIPIPAPPAQPIRDYKALYDDLQRKYAYMRDNTVDNEITRIKASNLQDSNQQTYLKYLNDLYFKLDNLLGKVGKRIPSEFDFWKTTYDQIVYEYNNRNKNYNVAFNEVAALLATQEKQTLLDAAVDAAEKAEKQALYVKEIKIELVELQQLSNKIGLYANDWPTLVGILNGSKKIDGNPLFYSRILPKDRWGNERWISFPFTVGVKPSDEDIRFFITEYNDFLGLELVKNQ